jgi:1-deoxy-D-xylulose-5-phosphate reductoisomerase
MRVPISFALTYPDRAATRVPPLDFSAGLTLEFEPPDLDVFPLLRLAREAGGRGGTAPCAFNAANEVAVAAFLAGQVPFPAIAEMVEETVTATDWPAPGDLDELIEADAEARRIAEGAATPA